MRFNPPPNWPPAPPGWEPPPGWRPPPSWGSVPNGWQLWVDDRSPGLAEQPLHTSAPAGISRQPREAVVDSDHTYRARQHHDAPSFPPKFEPVHASPNRPTNAMAIAALVFAIILAPIGLILGLIARGQIKKTSEGGAGLAKAAIIISLVWMTIPIVVYVVASSIVIGVHDNNRPRPAEMTIVDTITPSSRP